MTTYGVTVTPIGTARQGYRVQTGSGSFDIRTASPKRYLVVSKQSRTVLKRTNDVDVALRERHRDETDRIVIDRRIVDATAAGILDTGSGRIR